MNQWVFALLLGAFGATLIGCGQDKSGVPVRIRQKMAKAPTDVETRALQMIQKSQKAYAINQSSMSSQTIRSETIGVNISTSAKNGEEFFVDIQLSQNVNGVDCSVLQFVQPIRLSDMNRWTTVPGMGQITFMDGDRYAILIIERSANSQYSAGGTTIPAAVPVLLNDINPDAGAGQYVAMGSQNATFLKFFNEDNQKCAKPTKVEGGQIAQPISPDDQTNPTYDYFPYDDYYGGWY